jgi:hypothetical protein
MPCHFKKITLPINSKVKQSNYVDNSRYTFIALKLINYFIAIYYQSLSGSTPSSDTLKS